MVTTVTEKERLSYKQNEEKTTQKTCQILIGIGSETTSNFIVDQPTHEIKHTQAFYVNAKLSWDIYMSHTGG